MYQNVYIRYIISSSRSLLYPQRKVLGVRFWERNAERRLKFSNGKYISVGNFILMVSARFLLLVTVMVFALLGKFHCDYNRFLLFLNALSNALLLSFQNVDANKKAVLHHQSPIALAMGGNSHKDDQMVNMVS